MSVLGSTTARMAVTTVVLGALLVSAGARAVQVSVDGDELAGELTRSKARTEALAGLVDVLSRDAVRASDDLERQSWVVATDASLPERPSISESSAAAAGQHAHRAAVRAARLAAPEAGVLERVSVDDVDFGVVGGSPELVVRAGALQELGLGSLGGTGPLVSFPFQDWGANERAVGAAGAIFFPVLAGFLLVFGLVMDAFRVWRARNEERQLEGARAEVLLRMSHDLRTPAASVQALVEALQSGAAKGEAEREEFLALARSEASRLAKGIDVMLRAAQGEEAQPLAMVSLDLGPWSKEVAGRWQARLPGLVVSAPTSCPVSADPSRLNEAVDVLLDNALRYGGDRVKVEVLDNKDGVVVRVSDDGSGISWWDRRRVLEKHARGLRHLKESGSGLGLWVAGEVARAHGGTFELKGANRFELSLPR